MPSRKPIRLAPDLALPLDAVTHTFGIFGQRETGKSTTAAVLVEQSVRAGGRAVVMDPTGVWHGLTRAGTGPGLPGVVLGGEHGDAPLEPSAGGLVAEFVIGSEYALVVLDMKLMRKHQRQHFAMHFVEALYHDNRDPLMVVFDEAAQFAPTHMREGGDVPRLLGAVEDLVKLGRSRGLGATMIEQRIATLNANVREQIATLIAHRLVGPLDRKALKEWIAANGDPEREAEALAVISKLDPGTALVWSPAWLKFFGIVAMNNATTFDSRATPKVGEKRKAPGKRAPVDLATLSVKMAAAIEEARENDPKLLKQRVASAEKLARQQALQIDDMQAEIDALQVRPAEPVEVRVEVPVFTDEDRKWFEHIAKALDGIPEQMRPIHEKLAELTAKASAVPVSVMAAAAEHVMRPREPRAPVPERPAPVREPPRTVVQHDPTTNGRLPSSEQKVLDAVAWFAALGVETPTKQQVGIVAGYKVGKSVGGRYSNLLGALRNADGKYEWPSLIDYVGGNVTLTEAGRTYANEQSLPHDNEAVHEQVFARLDPSERKVLAAIIRYYPNPVTREQIAEETGYDPSGARGGRFSNLVGALRTLALIDYPQPGHVVALDVLFPVR